MATAPRSKSAAIPTFAPKAEASGGSLLDADTCPVGQYRYHQERYIMSRRSIDTTKSGLGTKSGSSKRGSVNHAQSAGASLLSALGYQQAERKGQVDRNGETASSAAVVTLPGLGEFVFTGSSDCSCASPKAPGGCLDQHTAASNRIQKFREISTDDTCRIQRGLQLSSAKDLKHMKPADPR